MTCIVGMVSGGRVVMGADRIGVYGDTAGTLQPKVFRRGGGLFRDVVVGYAGCYRFGQVLQYLGRDIFAYNRKSASTDRMRWLVESVVPNIISLLRENDLLKDNGGAKETDGSVLVGIGAGSVGEKGGIFQISTNFSVTQNESGREAIGSGWVPAMGALATIDVLDPVMGSEEMILNALRVATNLKTTVRPPFDIVWSDGSSEVYLE